MNGHCSQRGAGFAAAILVAVLVAGLVGVLAVAVWQLPVASPGLSGAVEARQADSGSSNPVTAVLLNFRAYDTLLELTVLLLAVLGAEVLAGSEAEERLPAADIDPILRGFVRLVAPVMIVVAGYVLWIGGEAPGGAFPSGAVLAAMSILLMLSRVETQRPRLAPGGGRWIVVAGLIVFWAVGIAMLGAERRFLEYPVPGAKGLVLLIESVAAVSIAATLVALFRGGRPVRRPPRKADSEFRS